MLPETRTGAGNSGAQPSIRDILAGETATDDIGFAFDKSALGNVGMGFNKWPTFGEDAPAKLVLLAEANGSHSSPFEPEAEAADA
jgi:hypothetical protein